MGKLSSRIYYKRTAPRLSIRFFTDLEKKFILPQIHTDERHSCSKKSVNICVNLWFISSIAGRHPRFAVRNCFKSCACSPHTEDEQPGSPAPTRRGIGAHSRRVGAGLPGVHDLLKQRLRGYRNTAQSPHTQYSGWPDAKSPGMFPYPILHDSEW